MSYYIKYPIIKINNVENGKFLIKKWWICLIYLIYEFEWSKTCTEFFFFLYEI